MSKIKYNFYFKSFELRKCMLGDTQQTVMHEVAFIGKHNI